MITRLLFIVFLINLTIGAYSQVEDRYDYLYASPNAAELGKYGLVPVNMSTGAMSTSIPLYTLKAGNLSVPINLSYSSTGVRVDQTASHVGLNWSLNAGGVITRIVRDKPDQDVFGPNGLPYPADTYTMNYSLAEYLDEAKEDDFDSERDMFSFNFLDFTGKLIFDYSGEPIFIPHRNIQVNHLVDVLGGTIDFVITDEQGIKYYFEAGETSRTIPSGIDCGRNFDVTQETGWYLTRIVHPQGDEIEFEYDWHTFTYASSVSQSSTGLISNLSGCSGGAPCSPIPDKLCQTLVYTTTARLKRIVTNGHGDVNFHYSKGRLDLFDDYKLDSIEYILPDSTILNKWKLEYVFSSNNFYGNPEVTGDGLNSRMFLTAVEQFSGSTDDKKQYSFEYEDMNGLPKRLSFSQDHWGFFNGKSNSHLFPKNGIVAQRNQSEQILFDGKGGDREPDPAYAKKGLLKKINYPTGGYSTIDYEANTYWGPEMIFPSKEIFVADVESHTLGGPGTAYVDTIYSAIDQDVMINFSVTYLEGAFEDPIHSFGRITVKNIVEDYEVAPGSSHNKLYKLDADQYYEVTIRAFGDGVRSVVNIPHYNQAPQNVEANYVTGGLRVARVINHDPTINRKDTTRYYYAFADDLTKSSGQVSGMGSYYQTSTIQIPCTVIAAGTTTCSPVPCYYLAVSSSSNINLNNRGGSHISYSSVIVSQGDSFNNGYEEHQFMTDEDLSGRIVYGDGMVGIPQTTNSWRSGLTKKITKFKKVNDEFITTHKLENTYKKDNRVDQFVPSMVVRSKYDNEVCNSLVATKICTLCDTSSILKVKYCTADHLHDYKWEDQNFNECGISYNGYDCKESGAIHTYFTAYNACFELNEGDSVYFESAIANLDAIEYRDYAHWFYLEKAKETTYADDGDSLVVERFHDYANAEHLQLTGQWSIGSDGRIQASRYWYPDDYTNIPLADSLKKNHIISRPIKMQQYTDQKVIGGEIVLYNPDGTITEIWKLNEETPSDSIAHDPETLLTTNYEKEGAITHDSGKPREIQYPDGSVATLIWSYNRSYLVAHIKNKTAAEVTAVSGLSLTTLEQSTDNSFINTKLELLRTALPDSHITTYNYRPGVGLISMMDPNNQNTFYEYDSFGRLKLIRDQEENILKTFDYHYKESFQPAQ